MNFEKEEIVLKRKQQQEIEMDHEKFLIENARKEEEEFLQLLNEAKELMEQIPSPQKKQQKKENVLLQAAAIETTSQNEDEPVPHFSVMNTSSVVTNFIAVPTWKQELQKKFDSVATIEDLDHLTKELLKKNRPRKLPKKKLVRVENFYQRHISGLPWMNNFLIRTKTDAVSRPYVERMLEMEKKIKTMIEEDELLGPQLAKDE